MNLKKSVFALAFAAAVVFGASAQDNYMHVQTASGWQVIDLNKVDRLTFKGGSMVATDTNNNVVLSVPQSNLETIRINESAGVANIAVDNATATFSWDASAATATMLADGAFEVYDTTGALIVNIPTTLKGQTVSLNGINPGVVILKSGDYALKVVVK